VTASSINAAETAPQNLNQPCRSQARILRVSSGTGASNSRSREIDTVAGALRDLYDSWEQRGLPGTVERMALTNTIERIHKKIDGSIETALRPLGLSRPRLELLLHLSRSESGSYQLSHLSDLLWLHESSVTSLVDHLERLGFLERVRESSDRRVILAHITPKGRNAVRAGTKTLAAIEFGVPNVTPQEAERLSRLLLTIM
jgi:DNA-binding MarR family transcriptional regulator